MRMQLLASSLTGLALATSAAAGPTLTADDFAKRRARVVEKLPPDAVVVLHAAPVPGRGLDILYRQDSDFWYLTGFGEPEAVAVLRRGAPEGQRYALFVAPRDWKAEQWNGWRAGIEGARENHRAEVAFPNGELWSRLPDLLEGAGRLYVSDGGARDFRERLEELWKASGRDASAIDDLAPVVHEMRLVKDERELEVLRHAVELSVDAHLAAMAVARPGAGEYELKGAMVGTCLSGGAARMGYTPIVGSGPNSVILHYPDASERLDAGEIVVNDTACEYGMYTADITRSYPASGTFSEEQRLIYEIVLEAEKAGIAAAKPGARLGDVYETTVRVVTQGLVRLGILEGDVDALVASREFFRFYPHGSSHWLGLDVHDVGSYGTPEGATQRPERYFAADRVLEPGMVFTVEPGIYVRKGDTKDRRWWDIGVRIEDDILITEDGNECLSCRAPREIADVEAALGTAAR